MQTFSPTFVPLSPAGQDGRFLSTGKSKRPLLAPEKLMRYLAKKIRLRTLILPLVFVAIIVACMMGVSRHSLLLEWSSLAAILVLLIADPLTSQHMAGAVPSTSGVKNSGVKRAVPSPDKPTPSPAGSRTLVSSEV